MLLNIEYSAVTFCSFGFKAFSASLLGIYPKKMLKLYHGGNQFKAYWKRADLFFNFGICISKHNLFVARLKYIHRKLSSLKYVQGIITNPMPYPVLELMFSCWCWGNLTGKMGRKKCILIFLVAKYTTAFFCLEISVRENHVSWLPQSGPHAVSDPDSKQLVWSYHIYLCNKKTMPPLIFISIFPWTSTASQEQLVQPWHALNP